MKEGDMNSKYYHSVLKARKARNMIKSIKDHSGKLLSDEDGIN